MTYSKLLALGTVAVIGLSFAPAHAEQQRMPNYNNENAAGFTSHHLVDPEPYKHKAENLPADEKLELREFLNYETREPCQSYQAIPQGFMRDGCHLRPIPTKVTQTIQEPAPAPVQVSNVLSEYEINFAFDSSAIETAADATINQIAGEINHYKPGEVIVAGFTDKAGSNEYNQKLSQRRAEAVSQALTARGVANRVIDQKAFGESRPAIDTQDGVALRENRRVVVEFRK